MMYGRTAKQIKIIALISFIISSIATVAIFLVQEESEFSSMVWLIPVAPLILTFGFMSLILNFKKIICGIITPIPLLSMFIEYFKGFFWSIKALIWALRQPKNSGDEGAKGKY